MAVDEAILRAVATGDSLPTLRLYDWSPPCLSLGYGQKTSDVDFDRLQVRGWDVVRRPTGGRAILHADELTYSLALPEDHPIASGGIVESYRRISRALIAGLATLGAPVQSERRDDMPKTPGPVCFEESSHYEITYGERKLIGSAQMRRFGGMLQHGTLPLTDDLGRICEVLAYDDDATRAAARQMVHARATTLAEALGGRVVTWHEAARAIAAAFAETFEVEWIEAPLSASEQATAAALEQDVYSNPERRRMPR
jgi:lipoate-protein ligase A